MSLDFDHHNISKISSCLSWPDDPHMIWSHWGLLCLAIRATGEALQLAPKEPVIKEVETWIRS